jgi:hypothetical protein
MKTRENKAPCSKFHGIGLHSVELFFHHFRKLGLVGLICLCLTVLGFLQAFPIAKYLFQLFNQVLTVFDWNVGTEPKPHNMLCCVACGCSDVLL